MSKDDLKFIIVASTAGSVMNKVLESDFLRSKVHSVVVDRECAAIEKAEAHGLPVEKFITDSIDDFCERLLTYAEAHGIDYVLSYYTNFYSQKFRDAYQDRIINFHPSILPAFKGMDGFGDSVAYFARFAGNTVEFIADVMDEGKIIMQTCCPLDASGPVDTARHTIFLQQCKALLQIVKWLCEGRVSVDGRQVVIAGAKFDCPSFSPQLEFEEAIDLK